LIPPTFARRVHAIHALGTEWKDRRSKQAKESTTSPESVQMRFRATESSDAMSAEIDFRGVNGPDPTLGSMP
jgi:hypothetical protein